MANVTTSPLLSSPLHPPSSIINQRLCYSPRSPISPTSTMEVAIPSSPPSMDFNFNSARSIGYVISAPSTPKRFGELFYYSAPTSPSRIAELHFHGDHLDVIEDRKEDNFAFDFNKDLERSSLSAEELFHGGQIKPQLQTLGSSQSPGKKEDEKFKGCERGRERVASLSGSGRRSYRSLSPFRGSERLWGDEEFFLQSTTSAPKQSSSSSSKVTSSVWKKWKLKDFLLFRSASEGRGSDKDPFRKYIKKKENMKAVEGSITRRRSGPISAHELHYTMNKAVSNDMKKKTFLPYKQGILGRLAFNPAVHALANGFGSLYR